MLRILNFSVPKFWIVWIVILEIFYNPFLSTISTAASTTTIKSFMQDSIGEVNFTTESLVPNRNDSSITISTDIDSGFNGIFSDQNFQTQIYSKNSTEINRNENVVSDRFVSEQIQMIDSITLVKYDDDNYNITGNVLFIDRDELIQSYSFESDNNGTVRLNRNDSKRSFDEQNSISLMSSTKTMERSQRKNLSLWIATIVTAMLTITILIVYILIRKQRQIRSEERFLKKNLENFKNQGKLIASDDEWIENFELKLPSKPNQVFETRRKQFEKFQKQLQTNRVELLKKFGL
ncbi:hypothetical protein SSS_08367 [Sarcoptes scabiei]|uniref:Uncharacterized protein n=1 Tax=Sarcoptes scabiei TaxID=52283 RepID=A0A834VCN1_SARSC|nr:hypothetical protein SSS_08367 [Sarcoptes scabiei]